ncbi:ephexin-1 [Ictalurus punctatus]|uniref:Ephexin-1 n=1 Tax=Ictalurus punctatus TaxID=7998 RepID=A0A2D0RVT1_ICTPU|nr:ephexin-1 [Ictalurus punctatus]
MGTNGRIKNKPPLPPKPLMKGDTPQKVLDPPPSSTNSGTQYRPTPKPRLLKPGPRKQTLNQAGNADQASMCNTNNAAPNGSRENHFVLPACPPCCPCLCHNDSNNGPKKTQEHEDDYNINLENKDNKPPRRAPPDIPPLSARPLPKTPWQIMNEACTDYNDGGIYAEADMPKYDDTAPKRNEPEPSGVPSQKPFPTSRKCDKQQMAAQEQSKHQDNENVIFRSLRIKKKNSADKTKRKKLSVSSKPPTTVSSCSRSQSLQTSAKCAESSAATMLSSGWKVRRTRSLSKRKTKDKDGHSWKMLQESLWQERCAVKESGILSKITKEEILLQESIYEVATSEQSYLERLTVVVNHFMEFPELNSAIALHDKKTLFSSIHKMREISQNFLDSMVQSLGSSLFCEVLCDVVHHYATGPFGAYVDYIRNMPCQKHTLINLRKESPRFVEILNKLEEDPCCNRLRLDSFLSLPFQRISHLKVLMETVVKRTAPKSDIQASAESALTEISEVLEICNREVGKMKQIQELVSVANKIDFEYKALPLVSSSRWLIRDGEMTQLALIESIFVQKKNGPVHLILFNDLLLVASKKGADRYVVHDHVHRSLIEVTEGAKLEDDLEGYDMSRVFLLAILKNHRGMSYQLLLQASTLEERDSWLKVLRSEEGVYEEWDCPQVRCIEAFNGQQPGELSLQPEDIVSIIQKTSDGLMEGRRTPDGERGWFPAKYVTEIYNEHVQRRNLRQRHHVLQAAASIVKRRSICQDQHTTTCFNK